MTKKRHPENDYDRTIPTNPTANITDSMRAEAQLHSPERFENPTPLKSLPSSPKHEKSNGAQSDSSVQSSTSGSLVSSPAKKVERAPQVKFTGKDVLLEFQGDVLAVYSQSSGTISYDSFAPLPPAAFEKIKGDAKEIVCKGPDMIIATEQNLIDAESASRQPSFEYFNETEFKRSLFGEEHPGISFERVSQPPSRGVREQAYAKLLVSDMVSEFVKSGREDLELNIRITRKDEHPIIKMQIEKKKDGESSTPCKTKEGGKVDGR